jgi:hypothetical protein
MGHPAGAASLESGGVNVDQWLPMGMGTDVHHPAGLVQENGWRYSVAPELSKFRGSSLEGLVALQKDCSDRVIEPNLGRPGC